MSLIKLRKKLEDAAADVTVAYIEERNQIAAPGVPATPLPSLDKMLKAAVYQGAVPAAIEHRSVKRSITEASRVFGLSRNKLYSLVAANDSASEAV